MQLLIFQYSSQYPQQSNCSSVFPQILCWQMQRGVSTKEMSKHKNNTTLRMGSHGFCPANKLVVDSTFQNRQLLLLISYGRTVAIPDVLKLQIRHLSLKLEGCLISPVPICKLRSQEDEMLFLFTIYGSFQKIKIVCPEFPSLACV